MALIQRLESLRKRHTEIEDRIDEEESRIAPDETLLQQLKRDKLHIKDEITRLCSELEEKAA
ncbi:MAG: DUF465 domain-containing protein [Alphaproteobacteria bacterium]|nr:DUF465 domain-containing protein [Alphaproteobacteria bacterium]